MKITKQNILKIFRAMGTAYQKEDAPEVNEFWQMKVMSQIRTLGPLNDRIGYIDLCDRFVWRFAAVASFAAIILSVYALQSGFSLESELAKMYIENPVGFNVLESFEIL
ncbi:MAG: hypothetical protein GY749_29570 [Desulfobacteraceae bacterium]|nr:hypothetical protein [Desulfobacteraceae bacterium]